MRKDVTSGKNDERDGFQELLMLARDGKVDVVVVYRLDRLSRNVRDIYDFLDTLQKADVAFVNVTEGFDTTTAMGRAMLGVAAVFAQLIREMISENCRDGLCGALKQDFSMVINPIFTDMVIHRSKDLIVNEEESARVREIFNWFTEHGWGIEKIAKTLNLRGVPTKTGIQWSANTIAVMLRNQVYSVQVRANGSFVEGQHQAIASREQHDTAAVIIKSRSNLLPRSHDSVHLLSGLAHCGQCGKHLTVHYINKGPNKKRYKFYYHKADIKAGENLCGGLAKSAQILEATVVEQVARCAELKLIRKVVLADLWMPVRSTKINSSNRTGDCLRRRKNSKNGWRR